MVPEPARWEENGKNPTRDQILAKPQLHLKWLDPWPHSSRRLAGQPLPTQDSRQLTLLEGAISSFYTGEGGDQSWSGTAPRARSLMPYQIASLFLEVLCGLLLPGGEILCKGMREGKKEEIKVL